MTSSPDPADSLLARTRELEQRNRELAAALRDVSRSRTGRVLQGLRRLTKRGVDLDQLGRLADGSSAALVDAELEAAVVNDFHRLYYDNRQRTWLNTRWRGVQVQKLPLDLWLYQEILHNKRPDVIVETGTMMGGSALFMADLCELIGTGTIVSIDTVDRSNRPTHPRIEYVLGSSTDPAIVEGVRAGCEGKTVMVILDSDHAASHVAAELEVYAPLVTPGFHLIVEDTNVFGHPVNIEHGPGPGEALADYLTAHPGEFVQDPNADKYFFTFNPGGVLVKQHPRT